MNTANGIAHGSNLCLRKFQRLIDSLPNCSENFKTQVPIEEIEDDFGRFKIWCGNLGAVQKGGSSLDVRLRESRVMRDTVITFLNNLQETLGQCIDITTGTRLPWEEQPDYAADDTDDDEASESSSMMSDLSDVANETTVELTTELAQRRKEIHDAVTDLYRLSFKMRDPSQRAPSNRALSMKLTDPDTGEDLFTGYDEHDRRHVLETLQHLRSNQQPRISPLEPVHMRCEEPPAFLVERLTKAITNRRRYFAYWHRHALKLSRVEEQSVPKIGDPISKKVVVVITPGPSGDANTSDRSKTVTQLAPQSGLKTDISVTEISKYRASYDEMLETETVFSFATTERDVHGQTADLPPLPTDLHLKADFVCPYCWVLCPARQGKGRSWR
ncbi:hypothetical protein C7974DRAFT_323947 [Boeremia exigua]|uniref:uncharacterized protein n=1 Tax=Boeremia exigua TaxID=749465 RepID=UPI001E8CF132|nr:uncharacterized protein C7974DRAFT_323947 [Boeremia exigua]KAH6611804.1 hypothetical protein C7974DRAFT_323947 [Boeremia exigua]